MQTADILKSNKSQRNLLSLRHLFIRQLQNLCGLRLVCILDVVEADGGAVDEELDLFGTLPRLS